MDARLKIENNHGFTMEIYGGKKGVCLEIYRLKYGKDNRIDTLYKELSGFVPVDRHSLKRLIAFLAYELAEMDRETTGDAENEESLNS
jgi:hypothetical protein